VPQKKRSSSALIPIVDVWQSIRHNPAHSSMQHAFQESLTATVDVGKFFIRLLPDNGDERGVNTKMNVVLIQRWTWC
jgi:hypothetical protein